MMSKEALKKGRGVLIRFSRESKIGEKARKKNVVYVGIIDLEKAHNRVNREALWQVLRMYDGAG